MRQIYSGASRVLSWLGPASIADGAVLQKLFKVIDSAIDSTASFGHRERDRGIYRDFYPFDPTLTGSKHISGARERWQFYVSDGWLTSHGLPVVDTLEWDVFAKFMNNAYFQRIWIIQEIQVSDTATIRWGETEFSWVDIHNAVRFCVFHKMDERPGHPQTGWIKYLGPFVMNRQTLPLTFLTVTKHHRCADARDRVFAPVGVSWGITKDSVSQELNFSADYKLTWNQVFRNTVMAICRRSERLEILSIFQHGIILFNGDLPSWVGEWESDTKFIDFAGSSLVACGNTKPQLEECYNQDPLIAKGIIVDEIIAVNDPFSMPELPLGGHGYVEGHRFEKAWTLVESRGVTMAPTEVNTNNQPLDSAIAALAQTLCCDAESFRGQSDPRATRRDSRAPRILNLLLYAPYQFHMAFMAVQGDSPQENGAPPREVFWPESGILAAEAAFEALNPTVSHTVLGPLGSLGAEDIATARRLVAAFFASSSADAQDAMLNRLVAAIGIVQNYEAGKYKAELPDETWEAFNYNGKNLQDMRFFVTSSGNMGTGPNSTKPGDQICIWYGGPVPYVTRKIPAPADESGSESVEHWFLGGCYLHQMMDGQAMEAQNRERYPEKTFTFR